MRTQGPPAASSGSGWRGASRSGGGGGWRGGERRLGLGGTLLAVRGGGSQDRLDLATPEHVERARIAEATVPAQKPGRLGPGRHRESGQDSLQTGQDAVV